MARHNNPVKSYLYGLEHASHDFTKEKAFGKNIFTNAFPVSLLSYMSTELDLEPNYIRAKVIGGNPSVEHITLPLEELIGVRINDAFWSFEDSFDGYNRLATTGTANRSDLVVKSRSTGKETRAFEVKLVTAPTSGTASKPREQQSCEIVVRPPTIEQMCFSIAASYGPAKRHEIGDMIADRLVHPMDFEWSNERYMLGKLPLVVDAAEDIIREGAELQTPFVLNALWRTKGKSSVFDDECFDVFIWSDLAFLQLFTQGARRAIEAESTEISRPSRSVIWLVKSLFDYSAQGKVTFGRTHSEITYGGQTDKAGAFSGNSVMPLIGCNNFYHPRVGKDAYKAIIAPEGIELLSPERRLDGFIKTAYDYAVLNIASDE